MARGIYKETLNSVDVVRVDWGSGLECFLTNDMYVKKKLPPPLADLPDRTSDTNERARVSLYTIEGWDNEGPVRLTTPMPLERALAEASRLNDQGYVHVSLIDGDSGVQAPWHEFDFWTAASDTVE